MRATPDRQLRALGFLKFDQQTLELFIDISPSTDMVNLDKIARSLKSTYGAITVANKIEDVINVIIKSRFLIGSFAEKNNPKAGKIAKVPIIFTKVSS